MAESKYNRKLTAVLSADVQGYSRLMSEDEDQTVSTITSYRLDMSKHIRKFSGRVVDSPGDNLLAEFNSVVNAVKCAFEIQNSLKVKNRKLPKNRQMVYRIGINLGDIIHEGDRLYGDGVNIAARLESLADGGGICISGTAYDQVKHKTKLKYAYLGEKKVKNIAQPVKTYKVLMTSKAALPFILRLKVEVFIMMSVAVATIYMIYHHYIRYLSADYEIFPNYLVLNPVILLTENRIVQIICGVLIVGLLLIFIRQKNISPFLLQFIRGCFFFGVAFWIVFLPVNHLIDKGDFDFNQSILESRNLFVEVLKDNVVLHQSPATTSPVIRGVDSGALFLLVDVKKQGEYTWNKVLMADREYGWILRVIPPRYGAAAKRLTISSKFLFTYLDAAAFLLGCIGFVWGFLFYKTTG